MNCPYCTKEMEPGTIQAPNSHANYWLPDSVTSGEIGMFLSRKSVEKCGGVILGQVRKVGFLSSERSASYYCKNCRILLTTL